MSHPFQPEKAIREARERERQHHSPDSGLLLDILGETGSALVRVLDSLDLLHAKVDKLSQDQQHLADAVTALSTALDGLAAEMAAEVQALKDAQAANPAAPLDFGTLDTLVTRAQQMVTDSAPAAAPVTGTGTDVPAP